jgi:hypothetical protein
MGPRCGWPWTGVVLRQRASQGPGTQRNCRGRRCLAAGGFVCRLGWKAVDRNSGANGHRPRNIEALVLAAHERENGREAA